MHRRHSFNFARLILSLSKDAGEVSRAKPGTERDLRCISLCAASLPLVGWRSEHNETAFLTLRQSLRNGHLRNREKRGTNSRVATDREWLARRNEGNKDFPTWAR